MNFFSELDLAYITWWKEDKRIICQSLMFFTSCWFVSNIITILLFGTWINPLALIFGLTGYCFGAYYDTIINEVKSLVKKCFRKGDQK